MQGTPVLPSTHHISISNGMELSRDVLGQTRTGRPVVPLSWDKGRSKDPRTNSSIPGHTKTKSLSYCQKQIVIKKKSLSFFFGPKSRPGMEWDRLSKSRPASPVARFWACTVVPLSWDNEGNSVPLSRSPGLSRTIGNPTPHYNPLPPP